MTPKVKLLLISGAVLSGLIVIYVLLLTVGRPLGQALFGRGFAERQLQDYVQTVLRQSLNGGRCQAIDTDGNGYVACDYTTKSEPNTPRAVECSAWGWSGFWNRGCKARLPR